MYPDDHAPPHFHVRYGGFDVSVEIRTLAVTGGRLPAAVARRVRRWAALHRDELLDDWNRAQAKRPLLPIEPLR